MESVIFKDESFFEFSEFASSPPPTLPSSNNNGGLIQVQEQQNVTDSPNQQFFSVSTSSDPANGVQLKISLIQSQNQSQHQSGHQLLANYILKLLLDRKLNKQNGPTTPSGGNGSTMSMSTSTTEATTLATTTGKIFGEELPNFNLPKTDEKFIIFFEL